MTGKAPTFEELAAARIAFAEVNDPIATITLNRPDKMNAMTAQMRAEVTHEKFGEGDLMAIIFRTATYLQSLAGAGLGDISASAIALRDAILRPPLTPATSTQDTTPET